MATITIDPVNRIEGHLKATVTESGGVVTAAELSGTLFRGFELILNKRDPRDAPIITQRICGVCPTSHSIASNMCLDTALGITNDPGTTGTNGNMGTGYSSSIPANGRIIRNIIHGMDTVMSHITHLYHLSALDFINTSTFPGMAPFLPSYTASDMIDGSSVLGSTLVVHYVQALAIRRKCHTAGALFSGRQPILNAMVPGGVTTLFSSTYPLTPQTGTDYDMYGPYNAADTKSKFKSLMTEIRTFINTTYIPDVVTVAGAYPALWSQGVGCQRLLSYGAFPTNSTGQLTLKRGIATGLVVTPFDQANVVEYVDGSYYNYGILDAAALHPFDGKTSPNMGSGGYSWLKSPRIMSGTTPLVTEVGPLARMVISHVNGDKISVTEDDMLPANQLLGGGVLPAAYTVSDLVGAALGVVGQPAGALYSALGRHAARALECKFIADAVAGTAGAVTSWVDQLVADAPCYTYKRIPKQISTGYGLIEVPRGSLGHWIKIEGRKIAKYQCVVPTTWNASPKDGAGQPGPAEAALIGSTIGANPTDQIINILRLLHPFDFCIACAVHVVTPEGKEKLKFAIGADGRPKDVSISE
ncbi:MAG: nickel-dependent hydrogenase large subunit [Thermodesulfovibrionales bacterium]|jgi:hydrogenase large subunit